MSPPEWTAAKSLHSCPAARYPRSLAAVVDAADARHLSQLYFSRIQKQFPLRYYGLLHHLGHTDDDEFARTATILRKIQARITSTFGPNFMMINDFFSYRVDNKRMFPDLHQDYDFWCNSRCSGFNLWLLLDHHGMNASFDVYDVQHNWGMYHRLYSYQSGKHAGSSSNHSVAASGGVPHLDANAFHELRERGAVAGFAATKANVPLAPGDALVLRQPEVHRTDRHRLRPEQWRLALGFKVLERLPIERMGGEFGPVSQDLRQMQVRWPGLLPPIVPGRPWPDVYGPELLTAYRALGAPTWSGWLSATVAQVAGGVSASSLLFLVPVCFGVLLLGLAREKDRAGSTFSE
jgi:hypothetical protein